MELVGIEDPWGQLTQEPTYPSLKDDLPLYIEGGDPFDYVSGYTLDGMPMTRSQLQNIQTKLGTSRLIIFDIYQGRKIDSDNWEDFPDGDPNRVRLDYSRTVARELFTPATPPPQNTAGRRCDERLGEIFGGNGTVFATDRDPSTLSDPAHRNRNRLLSPTESPVNGHAHIYASETGAGVAGGNLFTPSGYKTEERAPYTAHQDTIPELQNYHRFTYLPGSLQRFGYSGGLVISFIHSGPTNSAGRPLPAQASDRPGSVLVGTIGNFGGVDVGGSDPGYVHSHIRFYKADRRGRRGAPIDPRRVFCRDLGF